MAWLNNPRVAMELGRDMLMELRATTDLSHRVSRVLMAWLNNPRVAMELDRDMLMELKATTDLNVHVGLSYATAAIEMGVELKGPRKVKGCEWWEP